MRTTLEIDDELLADATSWAAASGRTLSQVVEDALRQVFARRDSAVKARLELPVSKGGRLMPGIDLDDSAALVELMDGPLTA